MRHFRFAAFVVLWLLAACSSSVAPDNQSASSQPAAGASPGSATPPLRLVVQIVIDQLPSWTFTRDRAYFDGGIARLLRTGVAFSRVELPYVLTDTAPGHATIGTGAPPVTHGIPANSWWDSASQVGRGAGEDERHPVFAVLDPEYQTGGRSSLPLAVDGVADALRAHTAGAGKSVSISIKDRSALFATGRRPDLAIWYDSGQPAMTTSRFFRAELPAWLRELAREQPIAPRLAWTWNRLTDIDHRKITGRGDDNPGEHGRFELGTAFPVELKASSDPAKALRATPLADQLVLETGRAALAGEKLGTDDIPDLLSLSFSAHDYAAHYWGQESWERLDVIMRLDDSLADFFAYLDATVGRGRYAVVLTSDHGGSPLVETSRAQGKLAERIGYASVAEVARAAAESVLGPGQWVPKATACSVYFSPAFFALAQATRERAVQAVMSALEAMPGIGYVTRTERISGDCQRFDDFARLACNSVVPQKTGTIFLAAGIESYLTGSYTTHGTSHNSMNPENRRVPALVYAPSWPVAQAGKTVDTPMSFLQIAPTVAALLGVPAPTTARASALAPPAP